MVIFINYKFHFLSLWLKLFAHNNNNKKEGNKIMAIFNYFNSNNLNFHFVLFCFDFHLKQTNEKNILTLIYPVKQKQKTKNSIQVNCI